MIQDIGPTKEEARKAHAAERDEFFRKHREELDKALWDHMRPKIGQPSPTKETKQMAIQDTLNQRAKTHGSFIDNGFIMQTLKGVMRNHGKNWSNLPLEQREALEMIQHKIGRILSGDSTEPDHWRDIAGYASLIENILVTGQSHPSTSGN